MIKSGNELGFYISNGADQTFDYLKVICSKNKNIKVLPPVKYFDLPLILTNYDIGLVLYKGHIPNYVYNVPNKVYEYLICGLEVWYSDKLVSTTKFVEKNNVYECEAINYESINKKKFEKRKKSENTGIFFNVFNYSKIDSILG